MALIVLLCMYSVCANLNNAILGYEHGRDLEYFFLSLSKYILLCTNILVYAAI